MSGGVLGKRKSRGPTRTLLTMLRPPAPKHIAFNLQGGKDLTGPLRAGEGRGGGVFFCDNFTVSCRSENRRNTNKI